METLKKASVYKRLGAAFFDFFLSLITAMVIYNIIGMPIVTNATNYNQYIDDYYQKSFDAYLFVIAERNTTEDGKFTYQILATKDSSNEDIEKAKERQKNEEKVDYYSISENALLTSKEYDYYLTKFYTLIDDLESYKNLKINNTELFDQDGQIKENVGETKLKTFFDDALNKGYKSKKLLENSEYNIIVIAVEKVKFIEKIAVYISIFICFLVYYLILPFILKNRATIGKKIFSLGVGGYKTNLMATKLQMFIRFLAFFIIEFFISFFLPLFYLPLIISIVLMYISKNGSTIHDFLAKTIVVDIYENPLYESEEEMKKSIALLYGDDEESKTETKEEKIQNDIDILVNNSNTQKDTSSSNENNEA